MKEYKKDKDFQHENLIWNVEEQFRASALRQQLY